MPAQTSKIVLTVLSDTEIQMTRSFKAPKALVFEAHTNPEHLKQWWGLRGSVLSVCEVDLRVGGAWRFVQKSPEGEEYGFRGEYREITPPDRLSYTFEFEGMPGHVSVETITFEQAGDITMLIDRTVFASKEDRDGMMESGMEVGANESMDRLEELLATK